MAYSFQTFSVGQVLTAAHMNQVEYNIRDHVHGADGVSELSAYSRLADNESITGIWTSTNEFLIDGPTSDLRFIVGRNVYIDSVDNSMDAHIFVSQAGVGDFGSEAGHLILQPRMSGGGTYRDIIFAGGNTAASEIVRITGEGVLVAYQLGVGTSTPDTTFHVYKGDSTGTSNSSASMVVEDDTDHYIQMLVRGDQAGTYKEGIMFGDAANAAQGMIYFSHSDNSMNFRTDALSDAFSVSSQGKLQNTVYIDGYSVAPGIHGRKASGTASIPTNTKANDDLVLITSTGYTGSAWTNPSGYAGLYATENWSATANGTAFVIGLTANGTAASLPYPPQRFIIYSDGRVLINQGAIDPSMTASAALELRGTTGALLLPRLDVTQRNALTATDGMLIYLTGYGLHARTLGSWQNVVTGGGPDIWAQSTGFVGIGGASVTSAKLAINGTDGALLLPRLTVTQRNSLTGSDGMIAYITDVPAIQARVNGGWCNLVHDTIGAISTATGVVMISGARLGIGGYPNAYATLDLQSTTGALLIPRVTQAQRDAITPTNGMMMYLTDSYNTFVCYENNAWRSMTTGVIHVNTTTVGNIGVGEDDLMSYTMPANTLNKDNRTIKIQVWGNFGATGNSKTVNIYFGGTVVGQIVTSAGAGDWNFEMTVVRSALNVQKVYTKGNYNGSSSYSYQVGLGKTDSASIIIKCTGTGTADNDIEQKVMIVETLN